MAGQKALWPYRPAPAGRQIKNRISQIAHSGSPTTPRLVPVFRSTYIFVALRIFIAIQRMLERAVALTDQRQHLVKGALPRRQPPARIILTQGPQHDVQTFVYDGAIGVDQHRSEEHTSELQSLMRISYAVFCLKKKKHNKSQKAHNRRY